MCFEEGSFFVAYEDSAWRLAVHTGLKPTKRHYKSSDATIVGVGFPMKSRLKFMPDAKQNEQGLWVMELAVDAAQPFGEWKEQLPMAPPPTRRTDGTIAKTDGMSCLPVFRAGYDLLLYSLGWIDNLKRELRYSLGERYQTSLIEMLKDVYMACKRSGQQRMDYLGRAQALLEESIIYLRLLHDLRQLGMAQYANTSVMADEVEKQLENWYRSLAAVPSGAEPATA